MVDKRVYDSAASSKSKNAGEESGEVGRIGRCTSISACEKAASLLLVNDLCFAFSKAVYSVTEAQNEPSSVAGDWNRNQWLFVGPAGTVRFIVAIERAENSGSTNNYPYGGYMPFATPELQREYARKWIAKRRADWFATSGPCVKCGSYERLELDHIDRGTKVTNSVWSWSKQRRDVELAKCQVLCYDCHKKKTSRELGEHLTHGMRGMYDKGCRCQPCKDSHTKAIYAWREKVGGRKAPQRIDAGSPGYGRGP